METEIQEGQVYKPEDFCDICAESRKRKELGPALLVLLPEVTSRHGYHVFLCPDCDGSAVELALRNV